MNNIQMIDVNRLHPHPDNPRKDVGDVTELADSIRHSGVMQNITVVPHEGDYRVIIGQRRPLSGRIPDKERLPLDQPCVVGRKRHMARHGQLCKRHALDAAASAALFGGV